MQGVTLQALRKYAFLWDEPNMVHIRVAVECTQVFPRGPGSRCCPGNIGILFVESQDGGKAGKRHSGNAERHLLIQCVQK